MTSESHQHPVRCPWTLLLGPGSSLGECLPILEALALMTHPSADFGIEQLEAWHALFCDFPEVGRILIDADSIQTEQVGLVQGFLEVHESWELWLVGSDSSSLATRQLLSLPAAYWVPAPLDVNSLKSALLAPEAAQDLDGAMAEYEDLDVDLDFDEEFEEDLEDEELPEEEENDDLLSQVEEILRGEAIAPAFSFDPQIETEEQREVVTEDPFEPEGEPTALKSPPAPARYFRNQVADLADLVQSVDMTLERATLESGDEGGAAVSLRLEELRGEVLRLQQFTRTLAYIAAPPVRGERNFDLAPLLEEMLTTRRSEADAPRYLIRTPDPLPLRSDKQLIEQAFDALLFLSHKAAGEEGTVRVDGRVIKDVEDDPQIRVSIRFPAGTLEGISPAELLEPYALRRSLPELGANSLAAASGILQGQGGRVELHQEASGGLEWLVYLPFAG